MKKLYFGFSIIVLVFILFLISCYSENDLRQKYNTGYSEGRTKGYNDAKTGFEKQIRELQNKITTLERDHRNSIITTENNYRNSITTMQNTHRRELTSEYNRGFQIGKESGKQEIFDQIERDRQNALRRNRQNVPLFTVK